MFNINGNTHLNASAVHTKSIQKPIVFDVEDMQQCLIGISAPIENQMRIVGGSGSLNIGSNNLEKKSLHAAAKLQTFLGRVANSTLRATLKNVTITGSVQIKKIGQHLMESIDHLDEMTCFLWHTSTDAINNVVELMRNTLNVLPKGSKCAATVATQLEQIVLSNFMVKFNAIFEESPLIDEYVVTVDMLPRYSLAKVGHFAI